MKCKCEYCGGLGYVMADVGQLFECHMCDQTGYVEKEVTTVTTPTITETVQDSLVKYEDRKEMLDRMSEQLNISRDTAKRILYAYIYRATEVDMQAIKDGIR